MAARRCSGWVRRRRRREGRGARKIEPRQGAALEDEGREGWNSTQVRVDVQRMAREECEKLESVRVCQKGSGARSQVGMEWEGAGIPDQQSCTLLWWLRPTETYSCCCRPGLS